MTVWWLLVAVFAISWVLTLALRKYALAKRLMDIPNERSSHSIPTPRGGGVAIVAVFLMAVPFLYIFGLLDRDVMIVFLGTGLLVSVIGFADDHGHIPAKWRLLGHFAAASWGLFFLKGLPPILMFGVELELSWVGHLLAIIYVVWLLNLYNFMDGIDGLAGAEAIFVCFGACIVYWFADTTALIWPAIILAAAVAGFLCWNFPSARIFMGDAGSGFLGITLAMLSIQAAWTSSQFLWSWLILMGVFIVDATWTLIRRLMRGDKIYEAHRSHGYQFASRIFSSHKKVTLLIIGINVLWLFPIALWVGAWQGGGLFGLLVAYLPLCWLAYRLDAGGLENKA